MANSRMSDIAARHNTIDQKYANFTNLKTQADTTYTSANNMLTKKNQEWVKEAWCSKDSIFKVWSWNVNRKPEKRFRKG